MQRSLVLAVVYAASYSASVAQDARPSFDKVRDALRAAARGGSPEERIEYAGQLGDTGDPRAIEELLTALRGAEKRVAGLRDEIEKIGEETKKTTKVIDEQGAKGRGSTAGAINAAGAKLQEQRAEQDKKLAELKDAEVFAAALREAAGAAVAALDPSKRALEAAKLVEAAAKGKETEDRLRGVRVLEETAGVEARDALVGLLAQSADPAVRVAAIDALVRRADAAATPALAKALDDESWPVRTAAARGLGSLPTLDGVPALIAALGKADGRTVDELVAALEDLVGSTKHDNAPLWEAFWTKEGDGLKKLLAEATSEDRATRLAAYRAVSEKGLLVAVRAMILAEGGRPERDEAAGAPRRRGAAKAADEAERKLAADESAARAAAVGAAISSRSKPIRERAATRLLIGPFRRAFEALEDYGTAAVYAPLMAGVANGDALKLLDDASKSMLVVNDDPKNPGKRGHAARRREGHDRLRAAAGDAMKAQRARNEGPVAGGGKPGGAPAGSPEEIDPETGKRRSTTTFYGIKTNSKRVLYILDVSGSMLFPDGVAPAGGGAPPPAAAGQKLPIDVAKDELLQSVRSLPEDATFNVVFFSHEVWAWKEKPLKADKAGKAEAAKWIAEREANGATNIFDALAKGFQIAGRGTQDKRYGVSVDTIFLLSDGQANRGRIIDRDQIVAEVRRMNSEQKLKVHTIGIGKGHDPKLMRDLAELTGGTYVAK